MTAQQPAEQTATTPPRFLIHTFWRLHRAAYRVTGGRFGLQPPASGQRFGTMRLTTVGRRTGKARVAIIGYFEDGPNLVTLAMNGWGEADPAWWRNLQATPETVVELPSGTQTVRARAAAGAERERLWARFRDFPGWGDVDALAARRPTETAVVVLEPAHAVAVASPAAASPAVAPPAVAPPAAGAAGEPSSRQASASTPEARRRRLPRLALRHLWIVPGLAIAVRGNMIATELGIGVLTLIAIGLAPDLPRLLGLGQPHASGHLAQRVVRWHNLGHHPLLPLAVLAVTATGALPGIVQVAALVWLGHIVIGLGIGDRARRADGSLGPLWPGGPAKVAGPARDQAPVAVAAETAS